MILAKCDLSSAPSSTEFLFSFCPPLNRIIEEANQDSGYNFLHGNIDKVQYTY